MSILPTFSELGLDKIDKEEVYQEMAKKAAELLRDKNGDLLIQVKIKGTGHGFYWSPSKKGLIFVPRDAEYYYISWKKDDKGRCYLYLPHFFSGGIVICVEPEDIEFLGFN
jgi:hypothetical protein